MSEIEQLAVELEPVFRQIQQIKERHGISALNIESLKLVDQFWGSHGEKGFFMASRRFHHLRDGKTKFIKVK